MLGHLWCTTEQQFQKKGNLFLALRFLFASLWFSKTQLMETYTQIREHGEIKLVLTCKHQLYQLAFMELEGVMHATGGEKQPLPPGMIMVQT